MKKKIGLITHHYACNFGANLQALSTVRYFQKNGYEIYVIDWHDSTLDDNFLKSVSLGQSHIHSDFVKKHFPLTRRCNNSKDITDVINDLKIDTIVIGSDAVVQHHPFLSRISFPNRHIIGINHFTQDRLYPNQFWGDFLDGVDHPIGLAYMSVSCQNSPYQMIWGKTRKQMKESVSKFNYISVRDDWTKRMFDYILEKKTNIPITPDPVFSFNQNAGDLVPTIEEISSKFELPEKYLLLCFFKNDFIGVEWFDEFIRIAEDEGYKCFSFPLPDGLYQHPKLKEINLPLSPLEWYAIIKNSSGFVGRNMHPIVISLHNAVPCFSFDQYGTKMFNLIPNEKSSKIYHILDKAGFRDNRVTNMGSYSKVTTPNEVLNRIMNFDIEKCLRFSKTQQREYNEMMSQICKLIK